MPDQAHRETDKELEKMERKLRTVYGQAAARSQQKANRFFEKFQELDRIKQQQVKEGKLDQETYLTWRRNKMAMGENYRAMVDTLTSDMVNTNQIAASVVNGHLPEVYANNYNFGTYQIEHDSQMNTSFTLYDRQTVERLMRDNPDVIPIKARVDIPKDKLWNKRKINDVITQSILTGDSIPDIAKSLQKVAEMNKVAAVRTARTATTAAQNGGRIDSFKRVQEMGIKLRQQWLATLDSRTRDSHRALDGEIIAVAKDKWHPAKFSNGCRFPGDPQGPGHEIYNCRCTLIGVVDGVDFDLSDVTQRDSKLGEQSYDEWKAGHKKKAPIKPAEPAAPTTKTNKPLYYNPIKIIPAKEGEHGFTQEDVDRINKRFEELDAIWHAKVYEVVDTLSDAQWQWDHDFKAYTEHLMGTNGYSKRKAERIAKEALGERPTKVPALQGGTFNYDTRVMCLNPGSVFTPGDLSTDIENKAEKRKRNEERAAEGKKLRTLGNVVNTPEGLFVHEYGHAIDATYGVRSHPKFKELYKQYTEDNVSHGVSLYASENDFEFIAECFADSFMGEEQGEISKKFMKVLEEIVNGTT